MYPWNAWRLIPYVVSVVCQGASALLVAPTKARLSLPFGMLLAASCVNNLFLGSLLVYTLLTGGAQAPWQSAGVWINAIFQMAVSVSVYMALSCNGSGVNRRQ